ncbi:MAG: glycosyltransferase family 9 protein [Dehalococcoidales bacterium]|nr:glycosyltransferase family 9 protein [Dehalococcoidales bacterium]
MEDFFFLRPGALGDLLLAAPVMPAVRAGRPRARLTLAGQSGAVRLLQACGLVDVGLSQDDRRLQGLFAVATTIGEQQAPWGRVDVAVAWLRDEEGVVADNLRRMGARQVVVAPSQPPPGSRQHVTDHLFASVASLGLGASCPRQEALLTASASDRTWAGETLRELDPRPLPLLAFHAGSGSKRKNWPATSFATVIDALAAEHRVVLMCGPADAEATRDLLVATRSRVPVLREPSLGRLAGLLAESDAYVGNDSGLSHLAGLLGVPTVVLFGPTDPARWRPNGPRVAVLNWGEDPASLKAEVVVEAVLRAKRR